MNAKAKYVLENLDATNLENVEPKFKDYVRDMAEALSRTTSVSLLPHFLDTFGRWIELHERAVKLIVRADSDPESLAALRHVILDQVSATACVADIYKELTGS